MSKEGNPDQQLTHAPEKVAVSETPIIHKSNTIENKKNIGKLESLSDSDLDEYIIQFFSHDVALLEEDDLTEKLFEVVAEMAKRNRNSFFKASSLMDSCMDREEIKKGTSVFAKMQRALLNISRTPFYKEYGIFSRLIGDIETDISQDPYFVGAPAYAELAKDYFWRKDVPNDFKSRLQRSIGFAISTCGSSEFEKEFKKILEFKDFENYNEVAHALESVKYFWNLGQEQSFEKVSDFCTETLKKIISSEESNSNYLLVTRAKKLLELLEQSNGFLPEKNEKTPFELSNGTYAMFDKSSRLKIVPKDDVPKMLEDLESFSQIEKKCNTPPKYMLDEARNRGEQYIDWVLPRELSYALRDSHKKIQGHATIPIEDVLNAMFQKKQNEKDEIIFDYEYLVSRPIRELIQQEFSFALKDLTIKEQFFFLNYLKRVTVADTNNLKRFTAEQGVVGTRAFLSLERGGEDLGDLIIKFGTEHRELAEKVFDYYSDLLDSADKAEELVQQETSLNDKMRDLTIKALESGSMSKKFSKKFLERIPSIFENYNKELVENVRENLLGRAQKDIERALKAGDPTKIEELVKTYDVHAKEYVALLQEVDTGNIEQKSSNELSPEDKTQMLSLLQANFEEAYKDPKDEEFKTAVKESLEHAFSNPNTVFRIIRDKGTIISFNRFDTQRDHEGKEVTYFGSFNADPAYSGVGNVMLEKVLWSRLRRGPMMAHCDPTQPIAKKYIESGFIAKGFYELAGKASFEIWKTKDIHSRFASKNETQEDLVSCLETEKPDYNIRKQSKHETYPELEHGKVLTRYFVHNGETYLVFEEVPKDLREMFTEPNI